MKVGPITNEQIKTTIERIESLESDKAEIADEIKGVYAEAKALGYSTKIIRKVIAIRKREPTTLREEQELVELYLAAIQEGLPLFDPAVAA